MEEQRPFDRVENGDVLNITRSPKHSVYPVEVEKHDPKHGEGYVRLHNTMLDTVRFTEEAFNQHVRRDVGDGSKQWKTVEEPEHI